MFAADPLRLAQVLSNLLTNAAKYTDPEGHDPAARRRATATSIVISVSDNGIGIAAEALPDVFDDVLAGEVGAGPLRRRARHRPGARRRASSSCTAARSRRAARAPGRAASSSCACRARRARTPSHRRRRETPAAAARRRRRVLIADDNRDAAESLAMLLRMEGHEVDASSTTARQALAAFDASQPEVALLDIGMPELNGYEVARQRARRSLRPRR